MTRIETEVRTPEGREELKHEIEQELRDEAAHKKRRGCLIFLAVGTVLIVAPLLWLTTVVARTGLVHVPFLSSWLYSPAGPERTVAPLVGSAPVDIVNSIFARAKYDPDNGLVTTSATEQELTTLIRHAAEGEAADSPFILDQAQVAVEDGHIEVTAAIAQAEGTVPIVLQARPYAKDGVLQLELQEVVVGGYAIPETLVDAAYGAFGDRLLDAVHGAVDDLGTVWRVDLTQGNIGVTFLPKSSTEETTK